MNRQQLRRGPVPNTASRRHYPQDRVLTSEQLQERLDYWQQKLCLSHWVIDVRIEPAHHMSGALGYCSFTVSKCRASIELVDPAHKEAESDPYDMEQTLVHELLHIHFSPWFNWSREQQRMSKTEDDLYTEQPIERIAWILVEQDRNQRNYA